MADTDPEDEVDDVPSPIDGIGVAPDADTGGDQVSDSRDGEGRDEAREGEADPPPRGRFTFDDTADFFRNPRKAPVIGNEDRTGEQGRFDLLQDRGGRSVGMVGVGH